MNLYFVETRKFIYYVIAEHPTQAQEKLEDLLCKADYGFKENRHVIKITLMAQCIKNYNGKPFINPDENLIL